MEKSFLLAADIHGFGIGNRVRAAAYRVVEIIIIFIVDVRGPADFNHHNLVDMDKARVKGAGSARNFGFSQIINMVNF